jgi:hypothetical protein
MFATHGLPELLVTDNGSVFTSAEFEEFLQKNGVRHVTSAPYHPATNGLAERAVPTLKEGLKKSTAGDIGTKVERFLFQYSLTPHSTTGSTPANLLMGRLPRCHLDLMRPDITSKVRRCQKRQKASHDHRTKQRSMVIGDAVFVKNFGDGPAWLMGSIVDTLGSLSLQVKLTDGRIVRRHMDHVRANFNSPKDLEDEDDDFGQAGEEVDPEVPTPTPTEIPPTPPTATNSSPY